jgi:hypothetical protein
MTAAHTFEQASTASTQHAVSKMPPLKKLADSNLRESSIATLGHRMRHATLASGAAGEDAAGEDAAGDDAAGWEAQ